MTAYEQRSYPGAAADTLLNADIASNALTFSVSPGTGNGYPTGGSGPFFVAIDYDTSKAEKIRVTSRINDTFTIASTGDRGVDGTSAVAHSANAKVRAVWTATDAQEANRAAANTVGKVTTKGDLLVATGANTLARQPVGVDGAPLVADSTQTTGVRYDNAAWVAAATTLSQTNAISTTAGSYIRYKLVGKTCHVQGSLQASATTAFSGNLVIVPPVAVHDNSTGDHMIGTFGLYKTGNNSWTTGFVRPSPGQNALLFQPPGVAQANIGNGDGYIMQAGDLLLVNLMYETA